MFNFQRTFQESPLNSSTFQAFAKPGHMAYGLKALDLYLYFVLTSNKCSSFVLATMDNVFKYGETETMEIVMKECQSTLNVFKYGESEMIITVTKEYENAQKDIFSRPKL